MMITDVKVGKYRIYIGTGIGWTPGQTDLDVGLQW